MKNRGKNTTECSHQALVFHQSNMIVTISLRMLITSEIMHLYLPQVKSLLLVLVQLMMAKSTTLGLLIRMHKIVS